MDTPQSNPGQTANSAGSNQVLRIWWDKGYVLEEDEAINQVIRDWERQSGIPVELSFYTPDEIAQKALRASSAGNPPDVLFSSKAEYPILAWQGKLADVSDVMKPIEDLFSPVALEAAYLYNNVEQKRSYYAVPLHEATTHIYYWRDLLAQIGRSESDIPQEWNAFWEFWQQVQRELRQQNHPEIYSLGLPFSVSASDTYDLFEHILEAYNVKILDEQNQLQVNDPQVRQGIIQCLDWYTQHYEQGYVPPSALRWLDPDNNRSLLNRVVVMTPNPTLSIPLALRQDPDTYRNQLGILEFPNKPDGTPMRHLVYIRQVVVFANAKHQQAAKDFLSYLMQPQVVGGYLKSAGGRYLPTPIPAQKDPFWSDRNDPHLATATKTLSQGETRSYNRVRHPAYSAILEANLWGQALQRIVVEGISPAQAADEAIAQIKQIFARRQ